MKRYRIVLGAAEGYPTISKARMDEDPAGEWVKWEDVKGMIKPECNCKHYQAKGLRSYHCPEHGLMQFELKHGGLFSDYLT